MKRLLVADDPNNFNLIRIAMALLVVWSHSFALYFGSEASEPVSRLMGGVFNAGNLAVYVFFIVSGFLITQSFDRSRSRWSYLKKRVARIYPGYMVATCVCAFLILPWYAHTVYTAGSAAKTLGWNLLLQNYFVDAGPFTANPYQALNGSLWSIPYEFWCYLGVLFVGAAGLLSIRRRALVVAAFAIVIAVHVWAEATGRKPGGHFVGLIIGWPYLWLKLLPCFMAGMLIYIYRKELPRSGWAVVGGLALMIAAGHSPLSFQDRLAVDAILFPPVVGYTTCYLAFSRQLVEGARYGDFSYGTYLYAFPIQQLLKATMALGFSAFVVVSMLMSVIAGAASWHAVERWFQHGRLTGVGLSRKGSPSARAFGSLS
jgi:peptidoglycan/LPS O-acetylase OafA/YrhL